MLKKEFPANKVNLVSVTQIGAYSYRNSVAEAVEKEIVEGVMDDNVMVTEIPFDVMNNEEKRNEAILKAIKDILGTPFKSGNGVF